MKWPKICLCLTGETLKEDLALLEKYRKYIDMVELRADFLTKDEQLDIRQFPRMANIPCILTIRRTIDGGCYEEGEARRTTLFARALAYADSDPTKILLTSIWKKILIFPVCRMRLLLLVPELSGVITA